MESKDLFLVKLLFSCIIQYIKAELFILYVLSCIGDIIKIRFLH